MDSRLRGNDKQSRWRLKSRLYRENRRRRYPLSPPFVGQRCGQIEDIAWNALQSLDFSQLRPGLKVETYEVTVQGVCDRCQFSYAGDEP